MTGRRVVRRSIARRCGLIEKGGTSFARNGSYVVSRHALERMSRRRVSPDEVDTVLALGRRVHTRGAVIRVVGRRELERVAEVGADLDRLNGLHIVCSTDETTILTVYRNHDFRDLRPRYRRKRRWH